MQPRTLCLALCSSALLSLSPASPDSNTHSATAPAASAAGVQHTAERGTVIDPALAKRILDKGNARFVSGRMLHPEQDADKRGAIAKQQRPFAIILSCADSRVPPEILFDQGLGDLFVVRVAGNLLNDHLIGSIEYAVEHLGAKLVVVLGHERCGAVTAAVKGGYAGGHVQSIVETLEAPVAASRGKSGDAVENAILENVRYTAQRLRRCQPFLSEAVHKGEITVLGAVYDLDSGAVTWVEEAAGSEAAAPSAPAAPAESSHH